MGGFMKHFSIYKKIMASTLALLCTFSVLFTNIAFAKFPSDGLATDNVKMRKRASLNSIVETTVPQGAVITILAKSGKFYEVTYNNKKGYILQSFVQIGTEPTPTPAPSPTPEPAKYNLLSQGSQGYEVMALQEALTELRFYKGEIDANYGKSTKDAVMRFQKINGLKADGKAGDAVQKLIFDTGAKNANKIRTKVKTLPPIAGTPMEYGNRGQAVADLQIRLKELNYYNFDITRSFDMRTRNAIAKFQAKNGIRKNSGKASAETLALLYSQIAIPNNVSVKAAPAPTPLPPMPTEKLTSSSKGTEVKNLQKVLIGLGYLDGKANGKYDTVTIDAVKAFQKNNKLKQDGVAGTQTLSVMFSQNAIKKDGTMSGVAVDISNANIVPQITTQINYPEINSINRSIKQGDNGEDVRYMQIRLTELGYYNARKDGKFQADDRAALLQFQAQNNLIQDGIASIDALKLLYSTQAQSFNSFSTPSTTPAPLSVSLRLGDKGEAVKRLQERLIALSYLQGTADGVYGKSTQKAVTKFQKANKLTADGTAGAMTLSLLYSNAIEKNDTTNTPILKRGTNSPAVRELQNLLIRLGYLQGTADGKFGANTQLALIQFQSRNNLKNDGIAGALTLQALQSNEAKLAPGTSPTPKPEAPALSYSPVASQVKFENWYTSLRALCRQYPNITAYDYNTGISWQLRIFSTGSHADAVPITAQDTENMNRAFAGKTTWTPKPIWVSFSNGEVYMATTHNVPHGTFNSNRNNNFPGHLCIHFPRTLAQVQAIGPYATTHQNVVELGWQQTQQIR